MKPETVSKDRGLIGVNLGISFSTLLLVLFIGGYIGEIGLFLALMFILPAVLIALMLGLPIYGFFARRGWLDWWHAALGGALAMGSLFVIVNLLKRSNDSLSLSDAIPLLVVGALLGIITWFVGVYLPQRGPYRYSDYLVMLLFAVLLSWGAVQLGKYTYTRWADSVYTYGCIETYERLSSPTNQSQFFVTGTTESGSSFSAPVPSASRYSNPDIVGNCARLAKVSVANARQFRYRLDQPKVARKHCNSSCGKH